MSEQASWIDISKREGRRLSARVGVACLAGSVVVGAYLSFLYGGDPTTSRATHDNAVSAVVLLVYAAVAGGALHLWFRRAFVPIWAWLSEERPATNAERAVLLRQPVRLATMLFAQWVGAAIVMALLNWTFDPSGSQSVHVFIGVLLGGLVTSALAYLLIERSYRGLFALALGGDVPADATTLGVQRRLLLSWALGSGVPLVAILLASFGNAAHRTRGNILLAAAGLAFGGITIFIAGRSVADPIDRVRTGLRRVRAGDLDASVPVDDGGEVGLLEVGFNQMVGALRDRQRLEELFGRHVGVEVARQALASGTELGGEQRLASALFVDLVGSTALAENRAPGEVVTILNALFDAVIRTVGAEGGWVNKFQGDGALCVFGAPADQPDHAARALRAARTLRRELLALAAVHAGLDAGIGVSSGDVVAGNIGTEERSEYTVIGDPVNEAARLTDEAKRRPGRVLASERTVMAAGEEARNWAGGESVLLRGRRSPSVVFEPQGGPARRLEPTADEHAPRS